MRLTRLYLRNYRVYEDPLELELPPGLIGVYGSNEGLENTPDSSPGVLQPPPRPRGYELLIKRGAGKLGIPVVPSHQAILTRPINGRARKRRLALNRYIVKKFQRRKRSRV